MSESLGNQTDTNYKANVDARNEFQISDRLTRPLINVFIYIYRLYKGFVTKIDCWCIVLKLRFINSAKLQIQLKTRHESYIDANASNPFSFKHMYRAACINFLGIY